MDKRIEKRKVDKSESCILRLYLYGGGTQEEKERKIEKERAVDATQITQTPTYKQRLMHSLSTSVNNRAEIVVCIDR